MAKFNSGVPPAHKGTTPWNSVQAKASKMTLGRMAGRKASRFGHCGKDAFIWKATCPTPPSDPDLRADIMDFVGGLFRLGDIRRTADMGYWPAGLVFVNTANPKHQICVDAQQLNEVR